MTAADVMVEALIDWGVEVIFGLPGDGINGIMESLRTHQEKIRFVQVRHEEAAAFAADEMNARLIAVFTESGLMARRLAALRPDQRIIALTSSRQAINELSLIWGVESVMTETSRMNCS